KSCLRMTADKQRVLESLYKLTKKIDLAYPYKYNGIKMLLRGADFAPVIGEKFGESVSRRQL
ncbi:hypothetical protein, partial [Pseudoramibacter alactolyticus]